MGYTRGEQSFDNEYLMLLIYNLSIDRHPSNNVQRQLMEDSKRYREYLARLKEQELAREKELEEIMNEEIQKSWQKRIDQWNRESEARQRLLREVIEIRRQQVEDRCKECDHWDLVD